MRFQRPIQTGEEINERLLGALNGTISNMKERSAFHPDLFLCV
jgi:hypothetical protein